MIKINQNFNHAFWGSLGSLLEAFRDALGLSGGRWGWFGEPFGALWGSLGSQRAPLGVLGVCFADPWDPWGLLGHSRADFLILFGNYGSPSGSISGPLGSLFCFCLQRRLFYGVWMVVGCLLGVFLVMFFLGVFKLIAFLFFFFCVFWPGGVRASPAWFVFFCFFVFFFV